MNNINNEFEYELDYSKNPKNLESESELPIRYISPASQLEIPFEESKIWNFHPIGGPYNGQSGIGAGRNDITSLTIMQYE
jgi:hypothetical protein